MLMNLIERYVDGKTPPVSRIEIQKAVEEKNKAIGLRVAQRYTRGNFSIQIGDVFLKEHLGAPGAVRRRKKSATK